MVGKSCQVVLAAGLIGLSWTASVFTVKHLQSTCGYAKPYLITYLHELALGLCCAPASCLLNWRSAGRNTNNNDNNSSDEPCSTERGPASGGFLGRGGIGFAAKASAFGLLAFVSNCCFTTSLRFTSASSAMTLEQLTSVFIALLSCAMLGETYNYRQMLGLTLAVAGGVVTAQQDARNAGGGASPLSPAFGDALVVVTSASAALYMVLFKKVFGKEDFGWPLLLKFFTIKSAAVAAIGWVGLLLPFEDEELPSSSCGWQLLSANMFLQVIFNLTLAWSILAVSPLASRLFVLLGLPVSVLLDIFQGAGVQASHIAGVSLVVLGVAAFEAAQPRSTTGTEVDGEAGEANEHELCVRPSTPASGSAGPPQESASAESNKRHFVFIAAGCCLLAVVSLALFLWWLVQTHHNENHDEPICGVTYDVPNTGNYTWRLSGSMAKVQVLFDQGILLCAGFNHDEALRSFYAAVALAPREPMLYWAIAYAFSGNLNRPLTQALRLQQAQDAVKQLRSALAGEARRPSAEEAALFEAMLIRFPEERNVSDPTWVSSFDLAAFEALQARVAALEQPSASILALFGQAALETDPWRYFVDAAARTELTPVAETAHQALRASLRLDPWQPLALHYTIHLLEGQRPQPSEALDAADRLRALFNHGGPGHLSHMPSHAYSSAGRYHAASSCNRDAIAADEAYLAACEAAGVDDYNSYYRKLYYCHKHAALLTSQEMEGRSADSIATVGALQLKCHINDVGDHLHGVFATYAYEAERYLAWTRFGMWDSILSYDELPVGATLPPFSAAVSHFSRSLAFMSQTSGPRCGEALQEYADFSAAKSDAGPRHIFFVTRLGVPSVEVTAEKVLAVANFTLRARLAASCGNNNNNNASQEELPLWRAAVAAAEALPYFEPPFWRLDPALCLGERLRREEGLEAQSEAQQAFNKHLRNSPESGWGLWGLWQMAKADGNLTAANDLERRFRKAWRHADFELESACY